MVVAGNGIGSRAGRAGFRGGVPAGPGNPRDLGAHFSPRQIAEIVAVIGLFGFLKRWNATLRVRLEDVPGSFAHQALVGHGWQIGRHGEE